MNALKPTCDNCDEILYNCFIKHNNDKLKLIGNLSVMFNLCEDITRYIRDFAFPKYHTIRFKCKRFVYCSSDDESDGELDVDFTFTNEKYIICEKCMIVAIDYYLTKSNRLPHLRDDAHSFIWYKFKYSYDLKKTHYKHYKKYKYILPAVYYCDYYRNEFPLITDDGQLQITES